MPGVTDHLNQASHNEQFYHVTDKSVYSDWAMTTVYYAALHYIDAYLAKAKIPDPGAHDVRDSAVNRVAELRPIANLYFRLKSRSRSARYCYVRFSLADLHQSFNGDLANIKKHLLPRI